MSEGNRSGPFHTHQTPCESCGSGYVDCCEGVMVTRTACCEACRAGDTHNDTLRTPDDWCQIHDVTIRDPDGWRTPGSPAWTEPITNAEFQRRLITCTISRGAPPLPPPPVLVPRAEWDALVEACNEIPMSLIDGLTTGLRVGQRALDLVRATKESPVSSEGAQSNG